MNFKDIYIAICWPETQELLEDSTFLDNAIPINDGALYDDYGSASYMVKLQWLIERNTKYKKPFYTLIQDILEEDRIKAIIEDELQTVHLNE